MRIYYIGESHSRTLHVATALGVNGEAWSALSGHVQNWRRAMEDNFNVPSGRTLRGADLLSPNGRPFPRGRRNPLPTLEEGLEIMMEALRVVEYSLHNRGAISVINVCRRNYPFHRNRNRAAARERLLELVNASLAADARYAFFIEDEDQLEGLSGPGGQARSPRPRCPHPAGALGTATPAETLALDTLPSVPRRTGSPGTTNCCNWPAWSPTP